MPLINTSSSECKARVDLLFPRWLLGKSSGVRGLFLSNNLSNCCLITVPVAHFFCSSLTVRTRISISALAPSLRWSVLWAWRRQMKLMAVYQQVIGIMYPMALLSRTSFRIRAIHVAAMTAGGNALGRDCGDLARCNTTITARYGRCNWWISSWKSDVWLEPIRNCRWGGSDLIHSISSLARWTGNGLVFEEEFADRESSFATRPIMAHSRTQ